MAYDYDDNLPEIVDNDGVDLIIREKCDYRIVKKVIRALNDVELTPEKKMHCALIIFYENYEKIKNIKNAIEQMYFIIDCGNQYKYERKEENQEHKSAIMDWDYDWDIIAPEINKVLGYEIRTPNKYTHWWTLIGAYKCIGEGAFNTIVSIRDKKQKGKKMEKWEQEFYRENRKMIDLPHKLTAEEEEFLNSDW